MLWKPQPPPTAYFTNSTLNFVISESCMQESRHSPLRDIKPQSCRLGTDMLGTTAWLHRWPARFAVPLTCLSNAGHVKETTVLLASLTVKKYFFYHVEGVCARELTQTTPVVSGGARTSREHSSWSRCCMCFLFGLREIFTVSHPVNAWHGVSARAAFLVNTLAPQYEERRMVGKVTWLQDREASWVVIWERRVDLTKANVLDTSNIRLMERLNLYFNILYLKRRGSAL